MIMAYFLLVALITLSLVLLLISTVFTIIHRPGRPRKQLDASVKLPRVSILKPISNIDDGMEDNINTFYNLDYPDYEIVFGMDTAELKCRELVERVRNKYPAISTTIVSTVSEKKLNPKITTLVNMEKSCSGELYWMTDSNVRVEKDTLKNLVHEYITHGAKIVFSPIRGTGSRTLGSIIENAYLNFFVSSNIIMAWKLARQQIIVGKSMLIEKTALEHFGGFVHFKEYLAEDFIMGRTYQQNNLLVSTNYTWVTNYIQTATISKFWSRVVRWSKIRYNTERQYYFFEILINPVMVSVVSLLFLGQRAAPLLTVSLIAKLLLEYANFFFVNSEDRLKPWVIISYPFCVILKDALLFLIFFTPMINKDVTWRGRKIRIDSEGKIVKITPLSS